VNRAKSSVIHAKSQPRKAEEVIELPEGLQQRLRAFARADRWAEFQTAWAACWIALAASVVTLLIVDRVMETPIGLRCAISLAGWAAAALRPLRWLYRWVWARPDWRKLAQRLQTQLPEIGDRLLGAVELAWAPSESVGSVALRRAAIAQVAREMESVDFLRAVAHRPRRIATAWALGFAVLGWVGVWAAPDLVRNAIQRWWNPVRPVPRWTFVRLERWPDELILPVGEPFELECRVMSRVPWLAGRASLRVVPIRAWVGMRWVQPIGSDGRVRCRIPGITEPSWLTLRVGDAIARARLRPEQRPALVRLEALVQPPAWLGVPAYTSKIESGWLRVPEDSEVTVMGHVARPLKYATALGPGRVPLEVEGSAFRTPVFRAVRSSTTHAGGSELWLPSSLLISWQDHFGLTPLQPTRIVTEVQPDAPPSLRLEGVTDAVALLEDDIVPLVVRVADDFGVRQVWLNWSVSSQAGEHSGSGRKVLADGAQNLRQVTVAAKLSPTVLRWPAESVVELQAAALDHRPDRVPSTSSVVRLWIISRARHLQLLEEAARALDARLEELRRAEESRLVQTESLRSNVFAQADAEAVAQKTQDLASSEQAGAQNARRLAEEWERLATEALRNRDVPADTVQNWMSMAGRLDRVASDMMSRAAVHLQSSAAERSAGPREAQLALAAERQRAAVEELSRTHAQSQDMLNDLGARTLARRLAELARQEEQLGQRLAAELPKVAGVPASRLAGPIRSQIQAAARRHRDLRKEMGAVRDDLAALAQRTGSDVLRAIRNEMSQPDVVETMASVEELLGVNHAVRAVEQTMHLSHQIAEWARRLEPAESASRGGGGGGGGSDSMPTEVLLGLLRARVQQEALREATRELELDRHASDYTDRALALARRQLDIADGLRPLADRAPGSLAGVIRDVDHTMLVSAAELREPDTGAEAIGIQTEIIETLAAAVESGARQGSSAGALSAEAMRELARLVEQLGRALGRAGGGSRAGGTTEQPSGAASGTAGASQPTRSGPRGGVADPLEFPSEYRDLLEDYYRALEQP